MLPTSDNDRPQPKKKSRRSMNCPTTQDPQTEERILKYSNGRFTLKFKFFSKNRKWIGLHFITDDEILVRCLTYRLGLL